MRHPMLWTLLGLGAMVYLVAGAPLQGGEAPGTTPSMVVHPFDVQIDPLTNTSVHNREPVTYRVTIWNRSAFTQTGFLWFTVLCTGVDTPIRLDVYNVHGHRVRSLVNGRKPSGVYSTRWDGTVGFAACSGVKRAGQAADAGLAPDSRRSVALRNVMHYIYIQRRYRM